MDGGVLDLDELGLMLRYEIFHCLRVSLLTLVNELLKLRFGLRDTLLDRRVYALGDLAPAAKEGHMLFDDLICRDELLFGNILDRYLARLGLLREFGVTFD